MRHDALEIGKETGKEIVHHKYSLSGATGFYVGGPGAKEEGGYQ